MTTAPKIYDLADDRASVEITFPTEPLPVRVRMTTAAVEANIKALGEMRSVMLPGIPERWERQTVNCYRDPAWAVENDRLAGDVLLHLRHERFGWLHFVIAKAEARKLGEALIAHANRDPPE